MIQRDLLKNLLGWLVLSLSATAVAKSKTYPKVKPKTKKRIYYSSLGTGKSVPEDIFKISNYLIQQYGGATDWCV